MKISNIILSLLLVIGIFSCTEEPKKNEPTKDSLIGKWELKEAFTNNKSTQRLEGAYLEFNEDGSMSTNILGSEEKGSFEMKKNIVTQKTSREVKYQIEKVEPNDLTLEMDLASRKFQLVLTKAE